jgi:two-component system, cell cycle response regulator
MIEKIHIDTEEMTVVDKAKAVANKNEKEKGAKCGLNFMLTVVQGSDVDFGKIYSFSSETVRIGRDRTNTIQVNDRKVSKQHSEISIIKTGDVEQFIIKDLESTNGTYVNGQPERQRILGTGDKITIGETVLRFNYKDEIEEEYHSKLFNFAAMDSLTGLYNRRYILNELENQFRIARRNKRVFSIVVIDIDDFKRINDTFGHQAGDEFLKHVSFYINHNLREQDICGRIGGEEFLIILPETDIAGASRLANRIRLRIRDSELGYLGSSLSATVSAGISQYGETIESTQVLFKMADNALYEAKGSGKNKVVKAC